MTRHPTPRPTEAELEILGVLWKHGPSTVRTVHESLAASRSVGYTTSLKLLQIMAEKGLVRRDETERAHVYAASAPAERTQRRLVADLLDRAFAGSAARLVQQACPPGAHPRRKSPASGSSSTIWKGGIAHESCLRRDRAPGRAGTRVGAPPLSLAGNAGRGPARGHEPPAREGERPSALRGGVRGALAMLAMPFATAITLARPPAVAMATGSLEAGATSGAGAGTPSGAAFGGSADALRTSPRGSCSPG